jgi:hypothetical protein
MIIFLFFLFFLRDKKLESDPVSIKQKYLRTCKAKKGYTVWVAPYNAIKKTVRVKTAPFSPIITDFQSKLNK